MQYIICFIQMILGNIDTVEEPPLIVLLLTGESERGAVETGTILYFPWKEEKKNMSSCVLIISH